MVSSDADTTLVLMDVSASDGSCGVLLGSYRTADLSRARRESRGVPAVHLEDPATGRRMRPTRAVRGLGATLGLTEVYFEDGDVAADRMSVVPEGSVVHSGSGGRVRTTLDYASPGPLEPGVALHVTGAVTTDQSEWRLDTSVDQSH